MEKRNISIYWLIDKMITKKHTDSELNGIFNQAKAMHKEEIADAFGIGAHYKSTSLIGYHSMADEYYNETFGGEK